MGFLYFFHQRHMDQTLIISAFWCCRKAKPNKTKHLPRVTRISMRNSLTFFAFSHRCKALVVRRVWINDFSSIYFATLNYSWNFSLACIQYFLGHHSPSFRFSCFLRFNLNSELCMDYLCELCPHLKAALLEMHSNCRTSKWGLVVGMGFCMQIAYTQREPNWWTARLAAHKCRRSSMDRCLINCRDNDEIKRDYASLFDGLAYTDAP